MCEEIKVTIKKVIKYDLMLGLIVTTVLFFLCPKYSYIFLIGILIAGINFLLNGIINNYMLGEGKTSLSSLIVLLSFIRIFSIALVGALFFKLDKNNALFYIIGFCSHFISLLIYGCTYNKNK